MNAGYSKRPLVDKLGIKPGMRAVILNAPSDYGATLGSLPDSIVIESELNGMCDFIQAFIANRVMLQSDFPRLKAALGQKGALWISWRKGSSKTPADFNEDDVRRVGLSNGLVDVKVIAIDSDWSGLKFVYRLKDRT